MPGGLYLLLIVGLALLWTACGGWVFPLDDAYITLHNAQVLREGSDPNYGVSALTGATSLVHLALVTLLSLAISADVASYCVASGAILLYAGALISLVRHERLPRFEAILLVLIGLATAVPQLLNGLETGLAMAAVAWVLVIAAYDPPSRKLAVIAGVLPFIRPELVLLSAIVLIRQTQLRAAPGRDHAAPWRDIAADAALVLLAAAPWLAWNVIDTGHFLPSTLGAKRAFFAAIPPSVPFGILIAASAAIGAAGPSIASLAMLRRDRFVVVLLAFVGSLLLGFALVMPEALNQNGNRYAYLLLPVAMMALARLGRFRGLTTMRLPLVAQAAFCVYLLSGLPGIMSGARAHMEDHARVADWAQAHLPAGSRIVIHDAGVIAARTDLALIDLVGLKSPSSTEEHERYTLPSLGKERGRAIDAIARKGAATHALAHDHAESHWIDLIEDLRRRGWKAEFLFGPRKPYGFRLFKLVPPEGPG